MRSLFAAILSLLWCSSALAVTIDTVPVGNAGNAGDTWWPGGPFGSVNYDYRIGTYEVTNAQYAEFLNAKAINDSLLRLYNGSMNQGFGGITVSGFTGHFSYDVIPGRGDKPVNYVSWYDAIRFANWLHNGKGDGDTETGAYTLGPLGNFGVPINGLTITRNAGATWFLPSDGEWYKAAYHKNDGAIGNYFFYPTSSDTAPTAQPPPGGSNSANYKFTTVFDMTNVGAYTASASPYGTFDQGGNVVEWDETLIGNVFRGARGGSWDSSGSAFLAAGEPRFSDPTLEHATIGFRVATIPEPSTVILAAMGLVGLLAFGWGRRKR